MSSSAAALDAFQSCEPPRQPTSGGTKDWQAVYSVLTSPRCMNCHPVASPKLPLFSGLFPQDYPRQGDDRHPHCSTVCRRIVMASGMWSSLACILSSTLSCSQRFRRLTLSGVHRGLSAQVKCSFRSDLGEECTVNRSKA